MTPFRESYLEPGVYVMAETSPFSRMDDPEAQQPLLEDQEDIFDRTTSPTDRKGKYLAGIWENFKMPIVILLILGSVYSVIYYFVVPPIIEASLNGNGSEIHRIHLKSVNPLLADINVRIPIDKPAPFKVEVDLPVLKVIHPNSSRKIAGIFGFAVKVPAQVSSVWANTTVLIGCLDYSWIHWYVKQGLRHGFQNDSILLSSEPKVHIGAILSTWISKMKTLYEFQQSDDKIDLSPFEFASSDVHVVQMQTSKGLSYHVDFLASFKNIFVFTMEKFKTKFSLDLFYEGVPIVHIWINALELVQGKNENRIWMETRPEYSEELLNFIGRVSDGEALPVSIRNLKFEKNTDFDDLQDLVDGWEINFILPPLDEPDLIALFNQ